jgi:hypothetical protein
VKAKFKVAGIYEFRNARVADQEKDITYSKEAERHLIGWIRGLGTDRSHRIARARRNQRRKSLKTLSGYR